MSPLAAFAIAEAVPAFAGAGIALVATSFIHRHHEKRIQDVEHEVATLHANGAPGPRPTTPEVSQRYEAMTPAKDTLWKTESAT